MRGKSHRPRLEEITCRFPHSLFLSWGSYRTHSFPKQKCSTMCMLFLPKEAHQRLSTQGFINDWSCRHLLPSTYQNSRLPEGKQLCNISHGVCTKLRPRGAILTRDGGNPEIQVLMQATSQPCKQAFLWVSVLGLLTLLHGRWSVACHHRYLHNMPVVSRDGR